MIGDDEQFHEKMRTYFRNKARYDAGFRRIYRAEDVDECLEFMDSVAKGAKRLKWSQKELVAIAKQFFRSRSGEKMTDITYITNKKQ